MKRDLIDEIPLKEVSLNSIRVKENLKAILIGVQNYDGVLERNLAFAKNDADHFAEFLKKQWHVPEKNIFLFSGRVTAAEAIPKIRQICMEMKQDENLLFYFSGHGIDTLGNSSLLFSDYYTETGLLGLEILNEWFKECSAKLKIRIFDACHSGQVFSRGLSTYTPRKLKKQIDEILDMRQDEFERFVNSEQMIFSTRGISESEEAARSRGVYINDYFLIKEDGWITFCGCDIDESCFQLDDIESSVFSYCLLKGLEGRAKRGNIFFLEDLKIYVCSRVPYIMSLYGERQNPKYMCEVQRNVIVE